MLDKIAFHPATPEAAEKYDKIRKHFMALVNDVWPLLPDGPDKTVAMRKIIDAQRECIATVAVNETPADWENPHVARVLPHGDVALEPALSEEMREEPCSCGSGIVPAGYHTARAIGSDITHRRVSDGPCE